MTRGQLLACFQSELIKVLQKKDMSWQEFSPEGGYMNSRRFQYDDLIAVEFSYEADLWMHVWASKGVASSRQEKAFARRFTGAPRSLKILWNRNARNTAHNAAAILNLVVYAAVNSNETIIE